MMEDAMDGIMDDEESEEDTERIVAGVFDELNIQARRSNNKLLVVKCH